MPAMTIDKRVEKRLEQDKKDAAKAVKDADKQFQAALEAVKAARVQIDQQVDAIAKGEPVDVSTAPLAKAITQAAKARDARARAEVARDLLDSDDERERRLKLAQEIGGDGAEPVKGPEAARLVLLQAGEPMHYSDITRTALETGLVRLSGKTPAATMSAYLATAAKEGDTFVRVGPGRFDLAERVAKAKKAKAAKAKAAKNAKAKAAKTPEPEAVAG
jgi:hypothetical protein